MITSQHDSCFNIITISGRNEAVVRFRNSMDGDEFRLDQLVFSPLGTSPTDFNCFEIWGTPELRNALLIDDEPNKITIFCETEKTPPTSWAKKCEFQFRARGPPKSRCYINIKICYYSLYTLKYGIFIVKSAGNGHNHWKIDNVSGNKKHFEYFLEQFGFLDPRIKNKI